MRSDAVLAFALPASLALALAAASRAAEPRSLTLDEALALAEQAPLARAASSEVQRARAERQGAGLWPNPEIQLEREAAGEENEQIAALSISVPLSGRRGLERSAADAGLSAAEARARQQRLERRSRVREAFLDLVAGQERDRELELALGRLDELVRILSARASEGESSGYDRMRAEQERAEMLAQRLAGRGGLARARSVLASLVGLAPSDPLVAKGTLDPPSMPLPEAQVVRSQAASRGDVEALGAEADQKNELGRASARRVVPEPSVTLGRKRLCLGARCDSGTTVGLLFALPLFDRGQGASGVFHAEAAVARAQRDALLLEAHADGEAALAEARALRDAEAAFAEAPSPERVISIARAAYEAGEMRVFELLDACRSGLSLSLRRTEVRLAARRAEVALERATGVERAP